MKNLKFRKYQGAGNDFVMLDNLDGKLPELSTSDIASMCDRRFGIGADGILIISRENSYSFRMKYYNSDGSLASFCGNGARCICAFAQELGVVEFGKTFDFIADDGSHKAVCSEQWVDLQMIDVDEVRSVLGGCFLNTGVPHFVKIVSDVDSVDIMHEAPSYRHAEEFGTAGTNVNFISIEAPSSIRVRTFERGVEGETLACGTGIVASSIAASIQTSKNDFDVHAQGGKLKVHFVSDGRKYSDVWLSGPAVKVFDGVWNMA